MIPDEVGDPAGEHGGLAAPGAGDDQQRAAVMRRGLALGGVEVAEEVVVVGGEGELFHTPDYPRGCGRAMVFGRP